MNNHYLETLRRCNERLGPDPYIGKSATKHTASKQSDRVAKGKAALEAYLKKYPNGQRKVETAPGPQTRRMIAIADALRRERRGEVGHAVADPVGTHKLPPHIMRG